MILAGIDEAGYGPILGPLLVASAAVRLPGPLPANCNAIPDVWKALRKSVTADRATAGKIQIADSKKVYSPGKGLATLEANVLTLLATMPFTSAGGLPAAQSLGDVLSQTAATHVADISALPWYAPSPHEPFPLEASRSGIAMRANVLRAEIAANHVELVRYQASVVTEWVYNQLVDKTRNKASALFFYVSRHLDEIVRQHASEGLWVVCDRQGGRSHYGDLLRMLFEGWDLTIEEESSTVGHYLLRKKSQLARISFAEKGETLSLPTAAASMLCKYLREALMHRFNGWWCPQQPGLKPTAGYYTDGIRWLADTATLRESLGTAQDRLIRSR